MPAAPSMTPDEAVDLVAHIESHHAVGRARFEDFEIWPVIRMMIGLVSKGVPTTRPPLLRRVKGVVGVADQAVALVRPRRRRARPPWCVFLNQRSSRQVRTDSGYYDLYAEPLRDRLAAADLDLAVWDWADVPDRRPPIQPVDPIDLSLGLAAGAARARRWSGRSIGRLAADVSETLALLREQGIDLSVTDAIDRVLTVDRIARAVARRLGDPPPVLGFVMCFYGLPGLGFTLGCRRRGVFSVDVQHGVQGPVHMAYGRWIGAPGPRSALIPEGFWCWRDEDAAWIDDAFGPGRAVVGGNLALVAPPTPAAGSWSADVETTPASREILVSLQPGLGLPSIVAHAMVEGPAQWRWWLRPHPTTPPAEVVALVPPGTAGQVQIEAAAAVPLSELLRHVDVHVTAFSSVVLEAESFGVPSIVTDKVAERAFPRQLASGHATRATTAAELLGQLVAAQPFPAAEQHGSPTAIQNLLAAAGH